MAAIWHGMMHLDRPPCGCKGGPFSHIAYLVDGKRPVAECLTCYATFSAETDSAEAVAFCNMEPSP